MLGLERLHQLGFQAHHLLGVAQRVAGDEEGVLGAFAQRIDFRGIEIDVVIVENPRNPVQQARAIAGHDVQIVERAFFIRVQKKSRRI